MASGDFRLVVVAAVRERDRPDRAVWPRVSDAAEARDAAWKALRRLVADAKGQGGSRLV